MAWRMISAVLLLPGNVLVFIPAIILWASKGTKWAASFLTPSGPGLVAAIAIAIPALALMISSASLFMTRGGGGTPAPWDPIRNFIVAGPYRYVRNPMLIGVILFLVAEALAFASWPLLAWAVLFAVGNAIYFPLSEEPGLEQRFGEAYREYKRNVPRWLPRLTPWECDN